MDHSPLVYWDIWLDYLFSKIDFWQSMWPIFILFVLFMHGMEKFSLRMVTRNSIISINEKQKLCPAVGGISCWSHQTRKSPPLRVDVYFSFEYQRQNLSWADWEKFPSLSSSLLHPSPLPTKILVKYLHCKFTNHSFREIISLGTVTEM